MGRVQVLSLFFFFGLLIPEFSGADPKPETSLTPIDIATISPVISAEQIDAVMKLRRVEGRWEVENERGNWIPQHQSTCDVLYRRARSYVLTEITEVLQNSPQNLAQLRFSWLHLLFSRITEVYPFWRVTPFQLSDRSFVFIGSSNEIAFFIRYSDGEFFRTFNRSLVWADADKTKINWDSAKLTHFQSCRLNLTRMEQPSPLGSHQTP